MRTQVHTRTIVTWNPSARSLIEVGRSPGLCSNNYLGLADKDEIVGSAVEALEKYGAGGASVRFICGTYDIHRELESKVAEFLGTEAALTYTSCWNANTAVIPALLQPGDTVISDELNHASIVDGCRLIARGVNKAIYKHSDMTDLEEKLKAAEESPVKLVITDGVFSMEGDIAKLPDIVELVRKYDALLLVDDSCGVIGRSGRVPRNITTCRARWINQHLWQSPRGAGGGFVAGRRKSLILRFPGRICSPTPAACAHCNCQIRPGIFDVSSGNRSP